MQNNKKPQVKGKGILLPLFVVFLLVIGVYLGAISASGWLYGSNSTPKKSFVSDLKSKFFNSSGQVQGVSDTVKAKKKEGSKPANSGSKPQKSGSVLAVEDDITENSLVFRLKVFFLDAIAATSASFDTDVSVGNDLTVGNDVVIDSDLDVGGDLTLGGTLVAIGEVTAPNIVYSIIAGGGITVDGTQDITITNDDLGSSQLIFKDIVVGDDTISAGSNTDSIEFIGSGVTITANTDDKKITFAADTPDYSLSGWTDGGTTVYNSTLADNVGIGTSTAGYKLEVSGTSYFSGNSTFAGDVSLGDASGDTVTVVGGLSAGSNITPQNDLGADLGSVSLRFNNLYVANINSNSSQDFSGQTTFSYAPTDSTISEASVLINPTTSAASGQLLAFAVAGYQKAMIDEDGDLSLGYSDATSAPATDNPLMIYGHNGTNVANITTSGGAYFAGNVGIGSASPSEQLDITGNFNLPDTTSSTGQIKFGGTTYIHNYGPSGNIFVGDNAGNFTSTGTNNSAFGLNTLVDNTTGYGNSSFGANALPDNTTGIFNTAVGAQSLENNDSGFANVASGMYSLQKNTTGTGNVAMGYVAASRNTTGSYNTALGYQALNYQIGGSNNHAIGNAAAHGSFGLSNFTGNNVMGTNAGYSLRDGGDYNVLIGHYTARYLTSGTENVMLGTYAGYGINGTGTQSGNIAVGYRAGYGIKSGANYNTVLGYQAAENILTGSNNIMIGYDIDAPSATDDNQLNIGNLIFGTGLDGTAGNISTGNIGIGTSSPSDILTIGNSTTVGSITLNGNNAIDSSTTAVFGFSKDLFGSGVSGIEFTGDGRYAGIKIDSNMSGGYANIQDGKFLSSWSGPVESYMLSLKRGSTDRFVVYDDVITNNVVEVRGGTTTDLAFTEWNNIGIGTTSPGYELDVAGITNVYGLIAHDITLSSLSTSIISGSAGHDGYTNFSGGIGTGGTGGTGVQRLTASGNLVNIGSIQAGETHLTSAGTFADKVDKTTGANPYSVDIGDLNGDGKADLAVANFWTGTVSTFTNNGDGTFADKVDKTTGSRPVSVSIGDLNGDGKADLAVSNYNSNTVSTFINNGDGTFADKVDKTTGTNPRAVTIGDINGDGKADIATANYTSNTVSTFTNNGDGTFADKVDITTGTGPYSVAIGDLDGDGKADIATANYTSNTVSTFTNNGDGTFADKVDKTTGTGPFSVAIGDLNGDGIPDLAVTNSISATVSTFTNNGDGTFADKVDKTTGTGPFSVAIGDLNGDGIPDLAVANSSSATVSTFTNNGDGTFADKVDKTTGTGPYSVAIGDLDGDGKADIATANFNSATVSTFINTPTTMFFADASTGNIGIGTTTAQGSQMETVSEEVVLLPTIQELLAENANLTDTAWTFIKEVVFTAKTKFVASVEFVKQVVFKDEVKFNNDTVGRFIIPSGANKVKVTFDNQFTQVPTVYLSAQTQVSGGYSLLSTSIDGFIIILKQEHSEDVTFDWFAVLGSRTENATVKVLDDGEVAGVSIDETLPSITPTPDSILDPVIEATTEAELATSSAVVIE